MADSSGVYVMQIAAKLTGMHPQTLRKYERAGFLTPERSKTLRMYSNEDIARLMMIKRLVEVAGLNLAGVELALHLRARILDMKKGLASASISPSQAQQALELLNEMLEILGTG